VSDDLGDFTKGTFTGPDRGRQVSRAVFRKGSGPPVIVMAEIPGITPKVAGFARRLVDSGFTAVLPHIFGEPGRAISMPYAIRSIAPACVSKEFSTFAAGRTSPITEWLRALARHEHEASGGLPVGAVGMCFTGGFALGMAVDDHLMAPVLSQPSLPLAMPWRKHDLGDPGISPADMVRLQERAADDGLCVLGLRFTGDKLVPARRFARLRQALGDNFIGVEIDSSPGNPHGIPKSAHSVLTEHLVDEPGHPTHDALEQVLTFFQDKLGVPAPD
jgi:dienelactone hydrolase